jgi:tetratricopeptide (TPR) repeat protein
LCQFAEAQECLQQGLTLQSAAPCRDDAILLDMAQTMGELGKVLRYRGKLANAESYLRDALRIHQQTEHGGKQKCVADLLHELGVLYVKRHELTTAEQYLLRSKVRPTAAKAEQPQP